jgi:uncharacterized protein
MILNDFMTLIILGLFVGVISAFFGIGGGIILVPAIALIFPNLEQQHVLACSLSVIFLNSIINTYNLSKYHKLDWKIIGPIASFSILFSFFATQFAQSLSSDTLKLIFASFALFVSFWILKEKPPKSASEDSFTIFTIILIGFFSGVISGLTGVGGGLVVIPLLLKFTKVTIKTVSVYSNAIMIFTALSGVASFALGKPDTIVNFYSIGYVLPELIGIIIIGSFFGSKIGTFINRKVKGKTYKIALSILVFIVSLKMFYSILGF